MIEKKLTRKEKWFDEQYYQLIIHPSEILKDNPENYNQVIKIWKKAIPFLWDNFREVKEGGEKRALS
ncbi:MAG: hypothetical protein GF329_00955 [Candidatus Lokiarchaeota archaeon]|nr:hypothetical protein [Candidatus Lokiarchaeota archaeon]